MINQPWLAGEIPSKNEGLFLGKSSKSMVDFLARSSKSCCMSKGWPKCPKGIPTGNVTRSKQSED